MSNVNIVSIRAPYARTYTEQAVEADEGSNRLELYRSVEEDATAVVREYLRGQLMVRTSDVHLHLCSEKFYGVLSTRRRQLIVDFLERSGWVRGRDGFFVRAVDGAT